MIKKAISLSIFILAAASFVFAADNPQQPSPENNQSGYMLHLGANVAVYDKPGGIKTAILAKEMMVWVSGENDKYLDISTGGWVPLSGAASQQAPFNIVIGKKLNVYNKPGDKKEIATILKNVLINVLEIKDDFGRIKIEGWMLKPGVAAEMKAAKPDPNADLKDKGNSVIDIIDNRIVHDPDTSMSE